MNDHVKRAAKAPALLIVDSFVIVVVGDEGGEFHLGSFFSGSVHCGHLRSADVLAATQGCAEGLHQITS